MLNAIASLTNSQPEIVPSQTRDKAGDNEWIRELKMEIVILSRRNEVSTRNDIRVGFRLSEQKVKISERS